VILAIGFAVFLVYAFPGYMSNDSYDQLREARTGLFTDGNPPLMAIEWWVLDRIIAGPVLMLLLQSTLFLGGLYVLMQKILEKRAAAWCAIGILLFPPVMTPMAVIWKDSQMAAYLMAGLAALVQPRLKIRLIGLGLLAAACLMRHNAVAAAAPMVAILFEWRGPIAWWKRLGLFIAAGLFAVGALFGFAKIIGARHITLTPMFHDLMGMIAFSDDQTDDEIRAQLPGIRVAVDEHIQQQARTTFAMRGARRVLYGDFKIFEPPGTQADLDAFHDAWLAMLKRQPRAYIEAHWDMFRDVLGIDDVPRAHVWDLFYERDEQQEMMEHSASWSRAQQYMARAFSWLAGATPLFRPYVYALVALLLLAIACRDRLTLALFTSGLLYELSFMPAFAEHDYRYSHWMITTVVIACVILFIQRRRGANA